MIYIQTKKENTLTDSHIQEQQMHIYRVLSATSTKGAIYPSHRDIDHVNPSSRAPCDREWLLSDLCACVHVKRNGVVKEAIVLQ